MMNKIILFLFCPFLGCVASISHSIPADVNARTIEAQNAKYYAHFHQIDRILQRPSESLHTPQDTQNWMNDHLLALEKYNQYRTEYISKFSEKWQKPTLENYDEHDYVRVFFNEDGSFERSIIVTKSEIIKNSLHDVIDQLPAISMPKNEIVRYRIMRGIQFGMSSLEPAR